MKKFFKILGGLLLVLVAAFVAAAFIAPHSYEVTRSATLAAPKEQVFEQMAKFRNWDNWAVWNLSDPKMQKSYTGTDGTKGSKFSWVGTKDSTGVGSVTNTGIGANRVDYRLDMEKPFPFSSNGWLVAEDGGNGTTTATMGMKGSFPWGQNVMMLFQDMDKALGADFEKSLAKLNESLQKGASDYAVEEIQYPARAFAAIRKKLNLAEMDQFFGDSYAALGRAAGNRIAGHAAGLYYSWDEQSGNADLAAAYPVTGKAPVKGAQMVEVPAGPAYHVSVAGGYSHLDRAHKAIDKKLVAAGKKNGLVIEEYVTGPFNEKDSAKWHTDIYYLLQ